MIFKKHIIFFLITVLVFGCKKDDNEDTFTVNIISTEPLAITQFQENIMVKIQYMHPEGFVGFFDPDYLSLEVKDSRLANADYYHIIQVSPPNDNVNIKGELLLEIDAPFVFGNGLSETLTYDIRIQDLNQQWSNKVTTSVITVSK